ncbi:C40 family peptidase [Streptomyces sp. NPDC090025]|uniref:C40 family peptidase n=1 Tax=Streptomyces sp. NPDC090025 TaxID=3365922 RepID=UPI003834F9F4
MSAGEFRPSRRAMLGTLAGVAAAGALPVVAATPAAAAVPAVGMVGPTDTAPPAGPVRAFAAGPDGRLPMAVDPTDAWHFAPHPAGALTTRTLAGGLLQVSDQAGVLATLTTGARTVTLRGPKRWFSEQKKPFADGFARTVPSGWGSSPGGGTWSHHNGATSEYGLEDGRAYIAFGPGNAGKSRYSLLPDEEIGDVSVRARFSFDKLPAGAPVALALVFGAENVSNHYRARLTLSPAGQLSFSLEKECVDELTVLGAPITLPGTFAPFDHWWVRVEKRGDLLRARTWKHGVAEPEDTWHHSLYDLEPDPERVFRKGAVGVRGLLSNGGTAALQGRVYDFAVDSALWVDPPVVHHDTWVRVLPAPFDGAWTAAMEQRIRAWAADTTPDALAYTAMFRAHAPKVTDPAQPDQQVLGAAGYSKVDAAGLRYVGADFHEYLGVPWTFPVTGVTVPAEEKFKGCMDCSGFVRMVYGHRMGIPMLDSGHDGVNLPRTSKFQSAYGPGVVVAQESAQAPSLAAMRIGDVVFFDATGTDEVADHTGIYLGYDQYGNQRFASSRRTPNGPTIGDVGGRSVLNGNPGELYTEKLRVIRRF